ncbi:MAG: hypothetical protein ACJA0P_002666 [Planctomycetota bacterium]|jgi:hypothetical protein
MNPAFWRPKGRLDSQMRLDGAPEQMRSRVHPKYKTPYRVKN